MDALNGRFPHARLPLFEALRDAAVKGPIAFADILDFTRIAVPAAFRESAERTVESEALNPGANR
jgi:hypothetical protein